MSDINDYINNNFDFDEDAFKRLAEIYKSNWDFVFREDMINKDVSSKVAGAAWGIRFGIEVMKFQLAFEVMGYLSSLAEKQKGLSSLSDDMLVTYFNTGIHLADLVAMYGLSYNPEKHTDGSIAIEVSNWTETDINLVCALSREFPCFTVSVVNAKDHRVICSYVEENRDKVPASKLAVFDLYEELRKAYKRATVNLMMGFMSSLVFYGDTINPEGLESMTHVWAYNEFGYISMFTSLLKAYLMGISYSHTSCMDTMEQVQYFKDLVKCYDGFEVSATARPDGKFDVTLSNTSPFIQEDRDKAVSKASTMVDLPDALLKRMGIKRVNGGK